MTLNFSETDYGKSVHRFGFYMYLASKTNATYELEFSNMELQFRQLVTDNTGKTDTETPQGFVLSQNYPNPFNPTTNITYSIEKQGAVSLVVYNLLGNEIARLVDNQIQTAGSHIISFDASSLSSGVYFYKLQTNNTSVTKKMLLMK